VPIARTEIWSLPATDAARLLRERQISSRELTDAVIERIGQVNPR
jgi:hypothetical protein